MNHFLLKNIPFIYFSWIINKEKSHQKPKSDFSKQFLLKQILLPTLPASRYSTCLALLFFLQRFCDCNYFNPLQNSIFSRAHRKDVLFVLDKRQMIHTAHGRGRRKT